MANFLFRDGAVESDFNAYRVLIQERLARANLTLDAWELAGANPDDWTDGLKAVAAYPRPAGAEVVPSARRAEAATRNWGTRSSRRRAITDSTTPTSAATASSPAARSASAAAGGR